MRFALNNLIFRRSFLFKILKTNRCCINASPGKLIIGRLLSNVASAVKADISSCHFSWLRHYCEHYTFTICESVKPALCIHFWGVNWKRLERSNMLLTVVFLGFPKIKNSFKCELFTTNLFIVNLLKHLRSCQFTG